jgi:phosphoribosyl 1,2-cyclic phosphodiesterase
VSTIRLCPLSSGSSGNSMFLSAGDTCLLIDAGLTAHAIVQSLATLNVSIADIQGVLITHEHTDHIRGAAVLAKKWHLPLYARHGTASQLSTILSDDLPVRILPREGIRFGSLQVHTFPVPHDAAEPVGFVFEYHDMRVAVATDLGSITSHVKKALVGCQAIVLEANHDEEMLANGPYPSYLKERIRSRYGHLSNRQAARALHDAWHDELQHVVLAHISRYNNDPILARDTVAEVFSNGGPSIHLTGHYEVGPFLELS